MLKKTVVLAATAASVLALPTVAEARHYHRYSNVRLQLSGAELPLWRLRLP